MMFPRLHRSLLLSCGALALTHGSAQGDVESLSKKAAPHVWVEPLVPEKLPELKHPEYYEALDKAKAQLAAGRYKLALATLHAAGKDLEPLEAALVRGAALNALGRTDEALAALSADGVVDAPRAQVLRAVVLAGVGKEGEAIALLQSHIAANPGSIAGHYHLGAICEAVGDVATATAAYGWFTEEPQRFLDKWLGEDPTAFESAADVTLIGRAIDRHAILTGGYRTNKELHNIVLNMFVRAYDVIDRGYVPARVAAAAYYITHDDKPRAEKEIEAALAGNPNEPEALELAGRLAIDEHKFGDALGAADALRAVDPQSAAADVLEAHALLRGDRSSRAGSIVDRLLARRPRDLEALALGAAVAIGRNDEAARDGYLHRADSVAPGSALALATLAGILQDVHRHDAAKAYAAIAVERAPLWPLPRHQLGRLHMQLAEEDDARTQVETKNFVIAFDPKLDPILGEYLGDYMEHVHAEVTKHFAHTPKRRTVLEVFPTTPAFSVRTAGVPGAETYGAAFGPVITAVAPRAGATMGPFNFARVLRHEFTHVINLSQTDYRCPRWLTEGLATWQEGVPFRFAYVPKQMYDVVTKDKLAPIADLSGTLLRGESKIGGEMMYMQGFWVGRYLTETYGHDSVLKLLDGYRLGKGDDDAFRHAIGKPTAEFDKEFAAWAKNEVKGWGYDAESTKTFDELAKTGEEMIAAKQLKEATDVWQQANKLQPLNPLPHRRLAGLYLRQDNPREALPHLKAFLPLELADNRYAKGIARIYRDLDETDDAVKYGMEAVYVNPYDADAHELLIELYEKAGNAEGITKEKRVIAMLEELKKQPVE
jgi:predicted Zn-dependent protease